jgi:GxxExxY protein
VGDAVQLRTTSEGPYYHSGTGIGVSLRFLRFLLFQGETSGMHPLFLKADRLSGEVIGAAIEVHRVMGPGLLESIYARCLARELELRCIPAGSQQEVVIDYKGTVFKESLRCDLLIDNCLLVELKAVHEVLPIHKAQLLSYMKLLNMPIGLLFNFHEITLVDGVSRLILPGANKTSTEGN